ncbi:MAG: LPS export ABC transporter permease LptG [Aquabacterium sp.]|jgi:lipopolysaccharide export system permease protein|nr:MAG: LPS export ABC transporter permease LptG [Aquabacterium sp.]
MRTVRRLLYSEILKSVGFVAAAFLALFYFIDLVDELGDVGKRGYRIQDAVLYCLLQMPGHLYDLVPIALLIGATYAMARFASTSEFTILRTGGLGPGRALSLLAVLGLAAGLATFALGDVVVPAAERYASLFQGGFKGGAGGRNSAWLRDTADTPQGKRRYAVSVSHADSEGRFGDVRIYEFDDQGHLLSRTLARRAQVDAGGLWTLSDVRRMRWTVETAPQADASATVGRVEVADEQLDTFQWQGRLSERVVAAAVLPLKTMSTPALYTYMRHLSVHEQTGQIYEIQFWKKALYPLACLVMMALALPFAYLHARSTGINLRVFIGIMLGISFILINNITSHLGLLQNWQPWIAAASPSLIYLLLSMAAFTWLVRYR